MKKAQVSVEYLFIIAMALAIIIPGSMLFLNYTKDSNEKLIAGQINRIGKNIVNNAEQMYTIGENSWVTIEVNFPENTLNAYTVADSELVITYQTKRGITEAVFFTDTTIRGIKQQGTTSKYNISNAFHKGHMRIKIKSTSDTNGDFVSIEEP